MDYARAEDIFVYAVKNVDANPTPIYSEWRKYTKEMIALTPPRRSASIRALLACALLARSTSKTYNIRNINGNDYSARSLADRLIAPLGSKFHIDIGSTSANPLNGNAFVNPTVRTIDQVNGIRNERAWALFLSLIAILEKYSEDQAKEALRGYLAESKKSRPHLKLNSPLTLLSKAAPLLVSVADFLAEDSESGARAQAIVAAVCDTLFDPEIVILKKPNDPDRKIPGDVVVKDGKTVRLAFDVKDRMLNVHDISLSLDKYVESVTDTICYCAFKGIEKTALENLDDSDVFKHAPQKVIFFTDVLEFLNAALLSFNGSEAEFCNRLASQLLVRTNQIGVTWVLPASLGLEKNIVLPT